MTTDTELASWRRQWQSGPPPAADTNAVEALRRRVLRDTRWLKWSLIAPILVTIGVGGAMSLRAVRSGQPLDVLFAIETWIFTLVTWVGALWLAHGTWRPLADTTAAFIDISIHRRAANARGAIFGLCLYVAQLVFVVLALGATLPGGVVPLLTSSAVIVAGWVVVPIALVVVIWFRRRQQAEIERLRELKRELQSE